MPTCAHHGIGLTVWSPLAQGILTGKYNDGVPEDSRGGTTKWLEGEMTSANLALVKQLSEVAAETGITLSQLALAWILRRPEISCAITGATSVEHVIQNVIASDIILSDDVLAKIDEILDKKA